MSNFVLRPVHTSILMKRAFSSFTLKGRKRFYKVASVVPTSVNNKSQKEGFRVALDGRPLLTPRRNDLILPNKGLAVALAYEWNSQKTDIEPASMPLMTLTCTAVDTLTPTRKIEIIDELLRFFITDTVFYQRPDEAKLWVKQRKLWSPLIQWAREKFGEVDISGCVGRTNHPPETVGAIRKHLEESSDYKIIAIESLAQGCKSLIIPLALVDRKITAKEAIEASRVEEEHQIDEWGLVDGGHDIDRENIGVQVAAASILLWFS